MATLETLLGPLAQNELIQPLIQNEFIKALKKRFDKEGIEISWPVRKIYYADEKRK